MFGKKRDIFRDFSTYERGVYYFVIDKGDLYLQERVLDLDLLTPQFPMGNEIQYIPSFVIKIWKEHYDLDDGKLAIATNEFLRGYKQSILANLQDDWNVLKNKFEDSLDSILSTFDDYFFDVLKYKLLTDIFSIQLKYVIQRLNGLFKFLPFPLQQKLNREDRSYMEWKEEVLREAIKNEEEYLKEERAEEDIEWRIKEVVERKINQERTSEEEIEKKLENIAKKRESEYCEYCGEALDEDSDYCRMCGVKKNMILKIDLPKKKEIKVKPKRFWEWKWWKRDFKDVDPKKIQPEDVRIKRFLPPNVLTYKEVRDFYDNNFGDIPLSITIFEELRTFNIKGVIEFDDLSKWENKFIYNKDNSLYDEAKERDYNLEKERLILRLQKETNRVVKNIISRGRRYTRKILKEINDEIQESVRI